MGIRLAPRAWVGCFTSGVLLPGGKSKPPSERASDMSSESACFRFHPWERDALPPAAEARAVALRSFRGLHPHRPGVVVFKEAAEGGLRILGIQLDGVSSGREWRMNRADALKPDDPGVRRECRRQGYHWSEVELGIVMRVVSGVKNSHAVNLQG